MAVPREGESLRGPRARADYKVDENGCWIWQKALGRAGYASGHAHRLYWERANGPIPAGHEVHHKCYAPACVNPDHLEAMPRAQHLVLEHLHRNGWSLELVRQVRDEGRKPGASVAEVAARYDLHIRTVRRWWNAHTWAAFLEDGPIVTPPMTCALPGCDEPCVGHRQKRYCCDQHRSKATYLRKRAGLENPGGKNGRYFDWAEKAA